MIVGLNVVTGEVDVTMVVVQMATAVGKDLMTVQVRLEKYRQITTLV